MLEAIRYIFDLPLQTDKEYKESLIKNIFGSGGKAALSVVDKHGKRYIISRIYGEPSNVIDENGLLEKLVGGKIGKSAEITFCVSELTTAISQLLDMNKIPEEIKLFQLPNIQS